MGTGAGFVDKSGRPVMACSIACSGAPSRGQMQIVKALHLHLGLLSICSNCSAVLIVMGGHVEA